MSGCVKTSALAMRRAARGASTIPEFVGTGEFGVGTGRPKRVGIPLVLPVDPPPFTSHTVIEPLTPTDRDTMFRQIIKRRAYPVGCASRCRHGYPQAFVHAPMHVRAAAGTDKLDEVTPDTPNEVGAQAEHAFGWLTCPMLHGEIDRLEKAGAIDDVAAVILKSPALTKGLEQAHETVRNARRWLLPEKWRAELEKKETTHAQPKHVLFHTGLAGVSLERTSNNTSKNSSTESNNSIKGNSGTPDAETSYDTTLGGWRGNRVKCLHAHVGDYLVRGAFANPVGDLVLRRLQDQGVQINGTETCWRECAKKEHA